MVYVQPRIRPKKWGAQNSLGFWDTNIFPDLDYTDRYSDSQHKKEKLPNSGLCCSCWPLGKTEKRRKERLVLGRNMKVTVKPIVIGALGIVTKGLIQGPEGMKIRGRVEIIQTTALLRSTIIPRRVMETWRHLLSLRLQWKTISERWCEKLSKEEDEES